MGLVLSLLGVMLFGGCYYEEQFSVSSDGKRFCPAGRIFAADQRSCISPTPSRCSDDLVCPIGWDCTADNTGCRATSCGNAWIDEDRNELCDDGNLRDGDFCSADCKSNYTCGNGVIDNESTGLLVGDIRTEACDDGYETATCNLNPNSSRVRLSTDCQPARCLDGYVNTAPGSLEECDDGEETDRCTADCKIKT
jgi:cysteine-rich repeat protein